jgi:hypothetical protein
VIRLYSEDDAYRAAASVLMAVAHTNRKVIWMLLEDWERDDLQAVVVILAMWFCTHHGADKVYALAVQAIEDATAREAAG